MSDELPMKETLPDGGVREWARAGRDLAPRAAVSTAVANLHWLPDASSLETIYATALEIVVSEHGIPNVRAVAASAALRPLGLLAVETDYSNARVRQYFADAGDRIALLCADVYEREGGGGVVEFITTLMFEKGGRDDI